MTPDGKQADILASPLPTLLSVQYLRGLACLAVLVFHACGGGAGTFYIGQAGVDLFFVISGFIMLLVIPSAESTPSIFVIKRLTRLLPLYWTLTVALFLKRAIHDPPGNSPDIRDLITSLFFIPSDSSHSPIILQGWTLNYEVFFHLTITVCLVVSRKHLFVSLASTLLCLVAVGEALRSTDPILSAFTSPLLLEFLLGLIIARLFIRGRLLGQKFGLCVAGLALSIFFTQHLAGVTLAAERPLTWGLPSAMLIYGMLSSETAMPRISALKKLGDASYAIYLVHGPIINIVISAHFRPLLIAMIGIPTSLAIGYAVHVGERRIISDMRSQLRITKTV